MRVLVIYDISDNDVRAKLAEDLKRLGLSRIQRSAFMGTISPSVLKDLKRVCGMRAKGHDDVIHIVQLCDYDWRRVVVIGKPWSEGLEGDVVVV